MEQILKALPYPTAANNKLREQYNEFSKVFGLSPPQEQEATEEEVTSEDITQPIEETTAENEDKSGTSRKRESFAFDQNDDNKRRKME